MMMIYRCLLNLNFIFPLFLCVVTFFPPVAKKVKKEVSVRELEEQYNAAVKNWDNQEDVLKKLKEEQDQLSKEFQATIEDVR